MSLQGAFELIVAQCPMAVAGMLSGMGRRLAAASAIRNYGSKYDPTGRAAVATPVPATSKLNGAAGGGTAKRGEVVTICLVPAGGLLTIWLREFLILLWYVGALFTTVRRLCEIQTGRGRVHP